MALHHGAEAEGHCIICNVNALPDYWGLPWCDSCLDAKLAETRAEKGNRQRMRSARRKR